MAVGLPTMKRIGDAVGMNLDTLLPDPKEK